jgi:hypothetical protein
MGPVGSSGVQWGPVGLVQWGPVGSSGIQWGPVGSSGLQWDPVGSTGSTIITNTIHTQSQTQFEQKIQTLITHIREFNNVLCVMCQFIKDMMHYSMESKGIESGSSRLAACRLAQAIGSRSGVKQCAHNWLKQSAQARGSSNGVNWLALVP